MRRAAIVNETGVGVHLVFSSREKAEMVLNAVNAKQCKEPEDEATFRQYTQKVDVPARPITTHVASFDLRTRKGESYSAPAGMSQAYSEDRLGYGIKLDGSIANPKLWNDTFGTKTFDSPQKYGDALAACAVHK